MKELYAALAKAQAVIDGAKKESENPHYRSRYADLASVWDACRVPLTSHGLSVIQTTEIRDGVLVLVTTLAHDSGETVSGYLPLVNAKGDMQGLGSAITYARRYGLAAIVGVSPEDDDAHAASVPPERKYVMKEDVVVMPPAPEGYASWRDDFMAGADTGLVAMRDAWAQSSEAHKAQWAREPQVTRDAVRARATKGQS